MYRRLLAAALLSAPLVIAQSASAVTFVNSITIPANATDATPSSLGSGANINRLGQFSDLWYDSYSNTYYSLADRGPGGGLISYQTRFHQVTFDVASSGAISNMQVQQTTRFVNPTPKPGLPAGNFNGLNPGLLNGSSSTLGLSLDPEGLVKDRWGNFIVADEYGPAIRVFDANGILVRSFNTPANLVPKQVDNTTNYVDGRTTIVKGRQDNRGFEGLAISPDGTKLFAIMQDPLVNEGSDGDANLIDGEGRQSRNLRIVKFDVATGSAEAQYIYQLESLTDINGRITGTANDFAATAQGRSIGVSSILALNNDEFLVIERDNRGVGVEDPLGALPVGTKRVYKISLAGATDVSAISLDNTNTLPGGVTPVSKSLFLDIQAALAAQGLVIPEKFEGLSIGPQLADGSYLLIIGTDNDFSVTQSGAGTQFDVVTNGSSFLQIALDSTPPQGYSLLPTYAYAFRVTGAELGDYQRPLAPLPEPATAGMLTIAGIAIAAASRRRRRA